MATRMGLEETTVVNFLLVCFVHRLRLQADENSSVVVVVAVAIAALVVRSITNDKEERFQCRLGPVGPHEHSRCDSCVGCGFRAHGN